MQHRTEQEILLQMIQEAQETGLLQTDEELIPAIREGRRTENQYVLDLAIHAHILEQLEDEVNMCYSDIDLNTATGEALDRLGRLVNVSRYPAQAAKVLLTVSTPAELDEMTTIPAGTMVIFDESSAEEGNYYTAYDMVFDANTQSASIVAEHRDYGFRNPVREGQVIGLQGFPYFRVTNETDGTTGKNIEEDASYRERIRQWAAKMNKGTRACIEDYLDHYDGLSSYNLIPRYDGVGTLKIVCDTLESLLPDIMAGVDENCMIATDYPCVAVLPEEHTIATLVLDCHKSSTAQSSITDSELENIIIGQVDTFVGGGQNRMGSAIHGLSIGDDFYPSQLVSYLLENVPEVDNIVATPDDIVEVPDTHRLRIDSISVVLS